MFAFGSSDSPGRLELAPERDPLGGNPDDRCVVGKHSRCILRILLSQLANYSGALPGCRFRNQLGRSTHEDKPQPRPLFEILIDKERNLRRRPDMPHPGKPFRRETLWLLINCRVED